MRPIAPLAVLAALLFQSQTASAQSGSGFLFGPPRASVGARLGYAVPAVDGELFDFSRRQFTLEGQDFRSPYFGGEIAVAAADRVDLVADFGWTRSRRSSEYRGWEDLDGQPVEQETTFERRSLTFGSRYYLRPRGRSVGQFAWVPMRIAPYLGAGVGVVWHEFTQTGDFVDFDTLDISFDRLQTSGSSAILDARMGVDVSLSRRVFLVGEMRYDFGSDSTGGDYVGFDDIDLSGFKLAFGVSFRL